MSYELISEEEYDSLPQEDDRCFVEFESVCRRNMTRLIDENTSSDFDRAVREQYIVAVTAVARECQIQNVEYVPNENKNFNESFAEFSLAVQGEVARIRIRSRGIRHPYSVLLTGSTRTKIEHYVSRIRDVVRGSDLPEDRKRHLTEKLDQFAAELQSQRLSFAKSMAILAGVLATFGSGVTIAAEGSTAVAHIMKLIGQERSQKMLPLNGSPLRQRL